ncbi:hypothetical protein BAUCODRAFT_145786 [Baudoinia panamericana UAMH 10762]|uniref:Major facilitator superfamily (MFS) profile domain-containing protein n=1 Tax=Baudoinia panamericana (strain UAMH 10762) TaxID=717646 RepID=M2N440_BAUPA|nr:uncharacterized protein BAUCODRAFT_145786 [Baudoinia panamericana UAMH 10762]EMC98753.1 hypothetical protein BAUCODRAFT_145786 [Baudoinia panamericana UAMH 10762]
MSDLNDSAVQAHHEKGDSAELREIAGDGNLVYADVEDEPALHWKTWLAILAIFFQQFATLFALIGPPTVLIYIGRDLQNSQRQNWIPNIAPMVQASLGPFFASASDTFQIRKQFLMGLSVLGFIGSTIAPGSQDIYRLIGASLLIAMAIATGPIAYAVPSEIVPRRWRPFAQGAINVGAGLAATTAPIICGAMQSGIGGGGWRNTYWLQAGLWGASTIGILVGYNPPKRHTRYDHLSWIQKLGKLDLVGSFLLTAGMTLLITGLNLGGNLFRWRSAEVLGCLISGILSLITFGAYEAWGTATGILHHDLFRDNGRHLAALTTCCALFWLEGLMFFGFANFYPILMTFLFTTNTVMVGVYSLPCFAIATVTTMLFAAFSSKAKMIRSPLVIGFAIWTAGIAVLAAVQPGQLGIALAGATLVGVGIGAPIVLIIAAVQLSSPHHLIATATAAVVASRALAGGIFTAVYSAVMTNRLDKYIPSYVSTAALGSGLPPSSLGAFIGALTSHDFAGLSQIPGVSPAITAAGAAALTKAYADGIRVIFIIAAPFGIVACIFTCLLPNLKGKMDYLVEAPMEELHHRHHHFSHSTSPGSHQ